MNVGDRIHNTMWVTGDESPQMRADYERQVREAIDYMCRENGVEHGDFKVSEHRPDADLSEFIGDTQVPDHIQGSKVRLLVIEAEVVKSIEVGSFVHNLERGDLMKLRKITRDAYARHFRRFPTQGEVDEIIESLGPDAAVEALRDQGRN